MIDYGIFFFIIDRTEVKIIVQIHMSVCYFHIFLEYFVVICSEVKYSYT